jgi:hypothetical protein
MALREAAIAETLRKGLQRIARRVAAQIARELRLKP